MRRAKPSPFSLATVFLLLFGSCSPLYRSQNDEAALLILRRSVDDILADSIFIPARAGIKIVSLSDGRVLYERDSKALFHPASNLKLLTTATALHVLGKEYKFKTVVYSDSAMQNGGPPGNLYIKGFGNPDLSEKDLAWMAAQLKLRGVRRIRGDVVGDVSFFDDLFWGKGWMWDDEPSSYEAFITPLSINKNCVKVLVKPGEKIGDPVQVRLDPETKYVELKNDALTGPDTIISTIEVTRRFKERLNTVVVKGILPRNSPDREFVLSVWKPELYAVKLFQEELEREGIVVEGTARLGSVGDGLEPLVLHEWPIDSVVINLNKVSDNLSAENTLKVIAAEKYGPPGTSKNGISIVNEYLSSVGIDTSSYLMADGSGVSHYNLVNAETIVDLLSAMYSDKDLFDLFYRSLPVAGLDGTLEKRMKGTSAEGRVRAKTGTESGVSSLSGYVQAQDGNVIVFSILMQDFIGSPRLYRDAQDKIVELLAKFQSTETSGL
ncbi:MAG: D-alanyl-D-alanine carboxypeptidase/D-alanyl-D-alanine-endopeptidase [Bacteroidota bacterium]